MEQKSYEQKGLEQELEKETEVKEKENILKSMFSWIFKNIKFLVIPAYRLKELTIREIEYEKRISKRKFIRR